MGKMGEGNEIAKIGKEAALGKSDCATPDRRKVREKAWAFLALGGWQGKRDDGRCDWGGLDGR